VTQNVVSLLALIQSLVYPMVRAMGGPDIPTKVDDAAPVLDGVADLMQEATDTVRAAAGALRDGVATAEEMDLVIAEAVDVTEKLAALRALIGHPAPVRDGGGLIGPNATTPTLGEPGTGPDIDGDGRPG
jgi:hypothetical protein